MATGMQSDTYSGTAAVPPRAEGPGNGQHGRPTTGQEATPNAKDQAGAIWNDAKEAARSKLSEQKDTAAEGLGGVAEALREASRRRGSDGTGDAFSSLTASAADGLDRLSSTLRNKDVGTMLRDMDTFARNQPVAFFGLGLAAGFLAVRFMKASNH